MNIQKSSPTESASTIATQIVKNKLATAAKAGKRVIWLLSGGSCIPIQAEVARQLNKEHKKAITVALVDERFVRIGSKDSNWQQIKDADFPFNDFANAVPILLPQLDKLECARQYDDVLDEIIKQSDYAIGVYGIGGDGHTAGIKPTETASAFLPFMGPELVVAYTWTDYQRITTTAAVIRNLDDIVVYAANPEKASIIAQLETEVEAYKMPAQLLHLAKNVVILT